MKTLRTSGVGAAFCRAYLSYLAERADYKAKVLDVSRHAIDHVNSLGAECSVVYSSKLKRVMIRDDLIRSKRTGKHWVVNLSPEGIEVVRSLDDTEWGLDVDAASTAEEDRTEVRVRTFGSVREKPLRLTPDMEKCARQFIFDMWRSGTFKLYVVIDEAKVGKRKGTDNQFLIVYPRGDDD